MYTYRVHANLSTTNVANMQHVGFVNLPGTLVRGAMNHRRAVSEGKTTGTVYEFTETYCPAPHEDPVVPVQVLLYHTHPLVSVSPNGYHRLPVYAENQHAFKASALIINLANGDYTCMGLITPPAPDYQWDLRRARA